MDIRLYALIKNMIKGITKGDKGDKGDPGFPVKVELTNPPEGYTLYNNAEYHISLDSGALALYLDFDKNYDGTEANDSLSAQIVVMFSINENITSVGFPTKVVWAVAEPIWVYGKTYMISFVPCGDKIIGAWAVV
ncbi:MAG: hypothetical protein IJ391_02735 [Clostridia bacterium]|nr:hypothetical protein [Clostridia bacterium]